MTCNHQHPTDLVFAQRTHGAIQALVANGQRAEATKARRRRTAWLANHGYHEVWQRTTLAITPGGVVTGPYELVALVTSTGKTWNEEGYS